MCACMYVQGDPTFELVDRAVGKVRLGLSCMRTSCLCHVCARSRSRSRSRSRNIYFSNISWRNMSAHHDHGHGHGHGIFHHICKHELGWNDDEYCWKVCDRIPWPWPWPWPWPCGRFSSLFHEMFIFYFKPKNHSKSKLMHTPLIKTRSRVGSLLWD